MKQLILSVGALIIFKFSTAQKIWDGGGGDGLWATATNWVGDAIPTSTDNVILDNSSLAGTYTVTLPITAVTVVSLTITPTGANIIKLILPTTNTVSPGFTVTGTGYPLTVNSNGVFQNSSGASAAPTITIGSVATDSMKINNGGTYEHNNARSATAILDKLSAAVGTETGLFHFNMKVAGTTAISLQGRTFGSVEFSAGNAPSNLTYSSTGTTTATPTIFRGNFKINSPAAFSSTILGGISIAGDFTTNGNFSYSPSASANPGTRSLYFNGVAPQYITGTATLTFGANFINAETVSGSLVYLQRVFNLSNAANGFIVNTGSTLYMGTDSITGLGTFTQNTDSWLGIGAVNGINTVGTGNLGNIQTATRNFSTGGKFEYNGTLAQQTGTALPSTIAELKINNTNGVTFNTSAGSSKVLNTLYLTLGIINTSSSNYIITANTTSIQSPINSYGNTNEGWEQSYINGPMLIQNSTTSAVTAPVGKGGLFAPLRLTKFNTNSSDYTIEYFKTDYSDLTFNLGQLSKVSNKEYWTIASSNFSASPDDDAYVTLSWRPYSEVGDGNPAHDAVALDSLVLTHYTNDGFATQWLIDGYVSHLNPLFNKTGDINYGYITTTVYTGLFSPFTLGGRSPFNLLPLKLISFNAKKQPRQIELNWATTEEQQLSHFVLEKSNDGIHFSELRNVSAKNLATENNYATTDISPTQGWNYYRLKIVEKNNKTSYTYIAKVWYEDANEIKISPNPVFDIIHVVLPTKANEVVIYNTKGEAVKTIQRPLQIFDLDLSILPKGIYFLKTNLSKTAIAKIIKQ